MGSLVREVTHYSAYCIDHIWEGGVHDDAEHLADEDAAENNRECHDQV